MQHAKIHLVHMNAHAMLDTSPNTPVTSPLIAMILTNVRTRDHRTEFKSVRMGRVTVRRSQIRKVHHATQQEYVSIHQEVINVIAMLDSSRKMVTVSTSTNALQKTKIKMIVVQIQIALIPLQARVNCDFNFDLKQI